MIRLCAFSDEAADDLKEQADALIRHDVSLTELRSVNKKNVRDLTVREAKEIAAYLSGRGIAVWAVGSPLGKIPLAAADRAYLDVVSHVCELARALGTDKVRAFSFYDAYAERGRMLELCHAMAERAAQWGVTLCHENEKAIFGDTAKRVAELMDELTEWKFVYDPANFLQVGERAEDTLPLAARCLYFHIKDVIAQSGELVPAGWGDGQIGRLVAEYAAGDKTLTIEPHLTVFSGYAAIDGSEMKHKFTFASREEAFGAAVTALKELLAHQGFRRRAGGVYERQASSDVKGAGRHG